MPLTSSWQTVRIKRGRKSVRCGGGPAGAAMTYVMPSARFAGHRAAGQCVKIDVGAACPFARAMARLPAHRDVATVGQHVELRLAVRAIA